LPQSFSFSVLHYVRQCHHSAPSFLSAIIIPISKTLKASPTNPLSSPHWSLGQYLSICPFLLYCQLRPCWPQHVQDLLPLRSFPYYVSPLVPFELTFDHRWHHCAT
jgi:hypothetical protein